MRITLLFFLMLNSFAINAETDAPVYYSKHCIDCHTQMVSGNPDLLYNHSATPIRDYISLSRRVEYCQTKSSLNWNNTQIKTVVKYLNDRFYKFNQ